MITASSVLAAEDKGLGSGWVFVLENIKNGDFWGVKMR